ncbi:hypothetical protein NCC78_31625, partial [Micromonospora phytophila]|uniref:hypothetical protein n=1 Tax=Micromonospora phytophila TaxID=709888 RepID=UPI0020303154
MTTGRASGLTTPQGHFWHAALLGDRSLARRLQSRAMQDTKALAAVLEGMFIVVIGWLRQNRFGPVEIRLFSERVTERIQAEQSVTTDEVSRLIHRELEDAATDDDVAPAHRVWAQKEVIATATRELKLTPGEIDRMISNAEWLARQWGIELRPYRPGLIMRWRFELAEGRWYGPSARDRWRAERMGAFIAWLRPPSETKCFSSLIRRGLRPGGGVVEVEAAGAVEGFFRAACGQPVGQDGV